MTGYGHRVEDVSVLEHGEDVAHAGEVVCDRLTAGRGPRLVVMDGGEGREMVPEQVLEVEGVSVGLHLGVGHCGRCWRHALGRHKCAQDDVRDGLDARQEVERTLWSGWDHECHSCEDPYQTGFYGGKSLVVFRVWVAEAVKTVSKVFEYFLVTHQDTQTVHAVPVCLEEAVETRSILSKVEVSDGIKFWRWKWLDIEVARVWKRWGYAVEMIDVVHGYESDCQERSVQG